LEQFKKEKTPMDPKILGLRAVASLVSLSPATIRNKVGDGTFPKPFKLGPRSLRWDESEIKEWLTKLPAAAASSSPASFQLEKYDGVEGFGPYEWYQHLRVRISCAAVFCGLLDPDDEGDSRYFTTNDEVISALLRNPLVLPKEQLRDGKAELLCGSSAIHKPLGVRSLTFRDLYRQDAGIPEERSTSARGYVRRPTARILAPEADWLSDPVFHHSRDEDAAGLICVDLALPNETLERDFHNWLADIRASADRAKYNGPAYKKWAELKLLPCLDLLLWHMQQRRPIRQSRMARALFPGEPHKEDAIRKTTLQLAGDFAGFTPRGRSLLNRLRADAASAISEQRILRKTIAIRTGRKVS
jgi:predicted DNA-binding transcriptional regulator AlpA